MLCKIKDKDEFAGKEKLLQMKRSLFANFSCYKLRAREHFVHDVSDRRRKGYGVAGIEEVFD
jgi:hypothetical protein